MKPTFYAILTHAQMSSHGCALSLQAACERKGIKFERLITDDISLSDAASLPLESGSLLYRISTNPRAQILESELVLRHPHTFTTIYYPKEIYVPPRPYRELSEQITAGLQIIPTIVLDEKWQEFADGELTERLRPVGGLPVVVKTLGLSHGQGVQKADTLEAFQEMLSKVNWQDTSLIARRYLADYRHYRLIVVADEVIAAIEYHRPDNDFRTNAVETPNVSAVEVAGLDSELIDMAVASTKLRASLLGGVDILVDQTDGKPYLAEVNVPCYFTRAETPTGIDIAGQIIDAMLVKREAELQGGVSNTIMNKNGGM